MRHPSPSVAGYAGIVGAVLLFVFAPFHAAAYFNTDDGSQDLFAHQVAIGRAIRDGVPAAYGFADPYNVYLTYGKATSMGIALLALAFAGLHATRDAAMSRRSRLLGRTACVAWGLLALFALLEYLTPFTDVLFLFALPSLLGTIVLTAIYGFVHARRRTWPRWVGGSLAAGAILFIPLVVVAGHVPMGSWGFASAWLAIGPWLLRTRGG